MQTNLKILNIIIPLQSTCTKVHVTRLDNVKGQCSIFAEYDIIVRPVMDPDDHLMVSAILLSHNR